MSLRAPDLQTVPSLKHERQARVNRRKPAESEPALTPGSARGLIAATVTSPVRQPPSVVPGSIVSPTLSARRLSIQLWDNPR